MLDLGRQPGLHLEVVLPMSFRRGFARPALAVAVAAILVLVAVGVFRATHDSVASGGDGATESESNGTKGQDGADTSWGSIDSLKEAEQGAGSRKRWLGVPAMTFDQVVGTVAMWPNGGDIEVRVKPVGDSWGTAQLIPDGRTAQGAEAAMVATDGAGTVTAAWVRTFAEQQYELVTTTRTPRGDWAEPTVLGKATWVDESAPVIDPRLAVGSNGSAAMSWTEESLTNPRNEDSVWQAHAVYRPAGRPWQREVELGQRSADPNQLGNEAGEVGIDNRGIATVLVADERGTRAFRNEGRTWGAQEYLDKGAPTDMVVSPDGTTSVVLITQHNRGTRSWSEVRARSRENGVWTPPKRLAPPHAPRRKGGSIYFDNPQLFLQSGITTVALKSWDGPVQGFTRPPGGKFSATADIAKLTGDAADVNLVDIWGNQAGQVLVIWGDTGEDERPRMLYGAYRQKVDGPWRDPVMLSEEKSAMTEDSVLSWSGVTAVVYPNGAASVMWSDGHQVFTRSLGETR